MTPNVEVQTISRTMPIQLGTPDRPLRVAIIGSGPGGFYAADALFNSGMNVKVAMFDRLPAPFGLVRYGVAPDHPKIKNVIKVYEKVAEKNGFSFLGNITIGKDLSVDELRTFYDAVIFACGSQTEKHMGIPGEDDPASHSATEFVAWYNGHPDFRTRAFDLSGESAVIIGLGNVAMDVARILSKSVDELKNTDIAQHALEVLSTSKIKEIHLVGRRGPVQAAFTPAELKEFGELNDCHPVVRPQDLEINAQSRVELDNPNRPAVKKNFELLTEYAAHGSSSQKQKRCYFHFLKSPVEFVCRDSLKKLILERTALKGEPGAQSAENTGIKEELKCDILFRSVGYRGVPIPGVPFDEKKGIFPNANGRIINDGKTVGGLYAAGWIKRGPSGVIGTNKADSAETVKNLLADMPQLKACEVPESKAVRALIEERKIQVIDFNSWKKIDAAEISRGQKSGKLREKFVTIEEMLQAARS